LGREIEIFKKVICIGDAGCGKTSLIVRFTKGVFSNQYKATIGADFFVKGVKLADGQFVKLRIWDLGGEERFDYLRNIFFKSSDGAIILFDLSNPQSFDSLSKWITQVNHECLGIPIVLIGNKSDLGNDRQVSGEDAQVCASENGCSYFETSAKDGSGVNDVFTSISELMINRQSSSTENTD
jgi:small GTP-binding protein